MVADNKALSITVLAIGLFLELQVHIEQEDDDVVEKDDRGEQDLAHTLKSKAQPQGAVNYFITPYTKQEKSSLTIDHLESILKFGSFELNRLISNGRYEVMTRDVTFSQVLVYPASAPHAHNDNHTSSPVSTRFVGCELREPLTLLKYEPSMESEQFQKLSEALGEDIFDILSALQVLHRIITGNGGLKELKTRLIGFSNNLPDQGKGTGRNLFIDCIYLLHGLCDVRISVPPTSYRDNLHRLLGFVLTYAGVSITRSISSELGTFHLKTTDNRSIHNHERYSNPNFAAKALLKCTIYGPDVDVGEIARSMMPMFVEDNLEPDSLVSLHHFVMQDCQQMVDVMEMVRRRCQAMKLASFSKNQVEEGKYKMEKFVQWMYLKCQHHEGERLLLYYHTILGVVKLVKQYDIFASACSHLDEGLFTALSQKGKNQAILLRAQNLQIIPKHPLDEIVDKRIWTFLPWVTAEKENFENVSNPDDRNAARLSFYHQFMSDMVCLLPHLQHCDMDQLKARIQDITTGNEHDAFWAELGMTSTTKRMKQFSVMNCGEFKQHLYNAPMDMSFINPELFQFRLIFCSNSYACRELKLYTSHGVATQALFQLDSKCKLCFRNALLCAVTTYQQLHIAFTSLSVELVNSCTLKSSRTTSGRSSKKDDNNASVAGKNRCLTCIKSLIDEFLPAAVIRYLWGRKAPGISDEIAKAIAQLKPLPPAQFPWFQHRSCGYSVPPTITCLLSYAKDIAKKKCLEEHTGAFEGMLSILCDNIFVCPTDEARVNQCVDAVINFLDHITDQARESVDKKNRHHIPLAWVKKLWPEESKKMLEESKKRKLGEAQLINDNDGAGVGKKVGNNMPVDEIIPTSQRGVFHNDRRVGGHSFILSECKGDNDEDSEEDEGEDSDGGSECTWNSKDNKFGYMGSINAGINDSTDTTILGDIAVSTHNVVDDASTYSVDETIPHLDLDLAMSWATNYAGVDFAKNLGAFLTTLAPFASGSVVSFKVTSRDADKFRTPSDALSQVPSAITSEEKESQVTKKKAVKEPIVLKTAPMKTANHSDSSTTDDANKSDAVTPTHSGKKQLKISFKQKNTNSSQDLPGEKLSPYGLKSPNAVTPATLSLLKKKKKT